MLTFGLDTFASILPQGTFDFDQLTPEKLREDAFWLKDIQPVICSFSEEDKVCIIQCFFH